MDYRNDARRALKRAEDELNKNDDHCLKYAALELRFAMEALTYDRAAAYKDELPPSEYENWQPRKLMAVLLEIDPSADKDSSISFGVEETFGVPPDVMTFLGSEKVLNMDMLKKHYDALGNFLHVPTLKQVKSGNSVDYNKFRVRCMEIMTFIHEVLASPIFNSTFGIFTTHSCTECGHSIRKRMPKEAEKIAAKCFECDTTYTVENMGQEKAMWTPDQQEIKCASSECNYSFSVLHRDMKIGKHWTCPSCNGKNIFALGICYRPASPKGLQNVCDIECEQQGHG